MLEKQITYDHSITELGHIQVRQITRIMEDGKEISKTYQRHVVSPGDDVTNEDARTKDIAGVVHTPEVIKIYGNMIKENEPNLLKDIPLESGAERNQRMEELE